MQYNNSMMTIAQLYKLYLEHPYVETDTRRLREGCLFFALSGANFNGNTFASQALEKGAAYAIIDDRAFETGERCIVVDNVLSTLQHLARYHRLQLNIPFLAITGSNGKTTTKELIAAVLRKKFVTYATEGNLNNHIGVPLTILKIGQDAQMAIIEMGANHQKEIEGYCEIAMPDYGLITNCGKAHIEGFGGIEGVRKGKGELYDYLKANDGRIFRNTDLDYLKDMAGGIKNEITYGSNNADYTGTPVMKGVFLGVRMANKYEGTEIDTHLVGDYNFPNAMAAIAVGLHFGTTIKDIQQALAEYNPDNSRSQWLQKGSNHIILDAYNANPTSMRAAITNFAKTDLPSKLLWIGGMKEMGTDELKEHRELVEFIQQYTWAQVVFVGKEFNGISQGYLWFENSADAANYIKVHHPENSAILIKGSRGSKMEVLLEAL